MPFTDGVFVNVAGATSAATGQTIQSATWNSIHADYSEALNLVANQLASFPTYKNILWMNGGLEVWQRGAGSSASISVAASTVAYTADRWYLATDTNQASVVSAQSGLTTGSMLCARVQRNSGQTGTGVVRFAYPLDTDEIYRLRGKFVRISATLQAGANWSPASGTVNAILYVGTGAVGKRNATPYTSETTVATATGDITAGGSATEITATSAAVVPTGATQAEIQFSWTPVGTASTNDWVSIDDVQIEIISAADVADYIPLEYERLPFDLVLAGCKRHYQKTFLYDSAPTHGNGFENLLLTVVQASEVFAFFWILPVEMRTDPTFSKFNPSTATSSNFYNIASSVSISAAVLATFSNTKGAYILTSASGTLANSYGIHLVADAGI